MPRTFRHFSNTGYMHLIVRGVGKQLIFEEQSDYQFYLKMLEQYSELTGVTIIAYCLMGNHVHLLVYDPLKNTPALMQRMNLIYATYYNRKYSRVGHLFQNRYLNENIDTEAQLMIVFRYILNNPAKAGICRPADYAWSSYHLYDDEDSFVDTTPLVKLFGSRRAYRDFIAEPNADRCMEAFPSRRDDEWAKNVIRFVLHEESGTALQAYPRRERNQALRRLKEEGLTNRQLERLTGISKSVIQRV